MINQIDIAIIKFFESIRNPVFDWFFYGITQIGGEYGFLILAVIIYWIYDKKAAHRFVLAFMVSGVLNLGFKQIVKRDRPYTVEGITQPNLPGVETSGYSFPSGHSQNTGVIAVMLNQDLAKKKKWFNYIAIALMVLVPISRVYLAQHYLSDVIVGLALGIGIAALVYFLSRFMKDNEHYYTLALVLPIAIVMIFVQNHDAYVFGGAFMGFAIGYFLEKMYVKYDVNNVWWVQILKILIGIVVALGLKMGLKPLFPEMLIFDLIRYFLIGIWAAVGAPLLFKYIFKKKEIVVEENE